MSEYLDYIVSIIEKAIKRKNTTAAKVSTEAVGNFSMIRNIKIGKSPRLENVKKLCDALGLELYIGFPEDYPGLNAKSPVFGTTEGEKVSGSFNLSTVRLEELNDCEFVPSPINIGSIIAVSVSDGSLSPIFSQGDLLFVNMDDRGDSNSIETFVGKLCLIQTESAIWIRTLRRGDATGKWNIESITGGSTITNQEIISCIPIRWIHKPS